MPRTKRTSSSNKRKLTSHEDKQPMESTQDRGLTSQELPPTPNTMHQMSKGKFGGKGKGKRPPSKASKKSSKGIKRFRPG
jgi:hypothetical protein